MRARLAGALLFASLSAGAQPKEGMVIHTFPPGAEIYNADIDYVGLSGQPLPHLKSGTYSLTFRLPGHKQLTATVSGNDFVAGVYPPQGELDLQPLTTGQALRDQLRYRWPRWAALLIGAAVLGLALRRLKTDRKRQVLLESFVPQGESRSLIMEQIGGYRVVQQIGEGGMAEVYLAIPNDSLDMQKAVAVKVMSRVLRDRPEFIERFEREIQVSGDLLHPGIVELKDWGWHGERLYLIMEYVEGVELRQLLPELKAQWARLANLLSQLMVAVHYAHERGVAHRDLKPENVMVTPAGQVKVMDFGLARAADSKTLTDVGAALGTPKYIAPESIAGSGSGVGSDQYTLGVLAYEMLTGQLPFQGEAVPYLLYSHSNLQPDPPSTLAPLPGQVDAVIARMMSKDPRERYESVEAARVELLKALEPLTCSV